VKWTRVLFVTHATTIGGGERSMLELAAALGREGCDVMFALPGAGPLAEILAQDGEEFIYYRANSSVLEFHRGAISPFSLRWWNQVAKACGAARNLRRVVLAVRPYVIHTHSQKAHVFASLAAAGTGIPVIWHMRDILTDPFARTVMDVLATIRAARVVAISEAVASRFIWARRKTSVIYNAVTAPTSFSRDAIARLKSLWGVPPDSQVVGCVGQIAFWKGHHVFIDAAAALAPSYPNLYFVVVGGPLYGAHEYQAELLRRVKRAGLAPRFRFLGQRADAPQCICAFDVLVHTPVKEEPFGRVVVEAMARRVPVVAARTGGIPEIMEDGREGFLVEPGNAGGVAAATAFLVDDPELRAEMGAHGRVSYLQRFNVNRLGRDVMRLYAMVLGKDVPRQVRTGEDARAARGADVGCRPSSARRDERADAEEASAEIRARIPR
jgi:glycosyltransferase involved in cell wall biosynthesis